MKILYVVNGLRGSGGLERVLLHKAAFLSAKYGYSVRILVLNELPGEPFYPLQANTQVSHFEARGHPLRYLRQYRRGLRDAVEAFQPDIVSVCDDGFKSAIVPLLLPRNRPILVYERHASLTLLRSPSLRRAMRRLARLYDQVVLLTRGNQEEWDIPSSVVIPNPLPSFHVGAGVERQRRILCVGSLTYNKGYDLLIDAWAASAARHPSWTVDVYGEGDAAPLRAMAAARGLADRIEFHPPVTDIGKEYQKASLLVLPSRSEGFGMVLLEAMSFGTPCISFDCPSGPRDILTHAVDGILVPPEDTAAMAAAIDQLISSPQEREALGRAARMTAAGYSIQRIAALWHQLFTQLATRRLGKHE